MWNLEEEFHEIYRDYAQKIKEHIFHSRKRIWISCLDIMKQMIVSFTMDIHLSLILLLKVF